MKLNDEEIRNSNVSLMELQDGRYQLLDDYIVCDKYGGIAAFLATGTIVEKPNSRRILSRFVSAEMDDFLKINMDTFPLLCSCLSKAEIEMLSCLYDFVCYNTNELKVGHHGNGKPMTVSSIAKHLDKNKGNTSTIINKLIDRNVLGYVTLVDGSGSREVIVLNPCVAMKGSKIERVVMDYFDKNKLKLTVD